MPSSICVLLFFIVQFSIIAVPPLKLSAPPAPVSETEELFEISVSVMVIEVAL